eukprot:COSAG01_NODE_3474_length_6040_cov_6.192055_5_plen_134_part_00
MRHELTHGVPTGDLHETLQRQPAKRLPESVVRLVAAELTIALDVVHDLDVVFRDLKPSNVLIDAQGHIVLTDFGLAKEGVSIRQRDTACGTPLYMAPEGTIHSIEPCHLPVCQVSLHVRRGQNHDARMRRVRV